MIMNIIVTGAAGFIGKELVKELSKNNHVFLVDRVYGLEANDIETLFWDHDIDIVYHLAAQTSVFNENHEQIVWDNIDTFVRVVDICKKYGTKLVYASSSTAYHPNTTSLYGLSKHFDEEYAALTYPSTTGVRLHNVYSMDPRPGTLMYHILNDEKIVLYNSGRNLRHFTHVSNAVQGLIYASTSEHLLLNCYNPVLLSTEDFTRSVCEVAGKEYVLDPTVRVKDKDEQVIDRSIPNINQCYVQLDEVLDEFYK